jgi:lipoate-protein ligase A
MGNWRFLPLEVRNGYWNMALDEAILKACIEKKSPNTVRLYKWNPSTTSIGHHQSVSAEINIDVAKEKKIDIVRRITGGGTVFHDCNGEITYSVICPINFFESMGYKKVIEQYEIITQGIVNALENYDLETDKGVIHCPAIFLNGKKLSGNAQVRRGEYLLQHGTILLEINPELMYSILKAPYNIPTKKMVASVYAKVTGIKEQIKNFDEYKFASHLIEGFECALSIKLEKGDFSQYEMNLAEKLVKEKYSTNKWLFKYE